MRWTMSMVRAVNQDAGHHHFDRKTMKFFGETMRNYRIVGQAPLTAKP